MAVTEYSVFMAVLCFDLLIVAFAVVRRKNDTIAQYGMFSLAFLGLLTVVRIVWAVEFPFAFVVPSTRILAKAQDFCRSPIPLFSREISVGAVFLLIGGCWGAGEFLWFLYQMIRTNRSIKRAERITDPEKMLLCQQVTGRRVPMVLTEGSIPYIAGFIHPTIFLPNVPYSETHLKYILMHEWQHFRAKDQWKKTVIKVLTCLFWWNPLVYLLRFDVEQMLELRCDYKVLGRLSREERAEYLGTILHFCGRSQNVNGQENIPTPTFVQLRKVLFEQFSLLKQRIALGKSYGKRSPHQRLRGFLFCLGFTLLFALSYMVIFQPAGYPSEEEGFTFSEFPEGTFLRENADGGYTIIVEGEEWAFLEDCDEEPFASMPVEPFDG